MTDQNEPDFFDTTSPDAAAVSEFLKGQAENSNSVETSKESVQEKKSTSRQVSPDEGFSMQWGDVNADKDEVKELPDPMVGMRAPVPEAETTDIIFPMSDDSVPVTDMDKRLYLKATLTDTPVELDIVMHNSMVFTVRSLSNYEGDLVMKAALDYVLKDPTVGLAEGLGQNIAQQYRVSMQITKINGAPVPYLQYTYVPGKSDKAVDSAELREKSNALMLNTQGIRYGLMLRALSVFQSKMNRLNAAAFSMDFWSPVSID